MKRFLILLGAFLIMQTIIGYYAKANDDIVWTKQTHTVRQVQFSPDSKLILTSDGGQLYLHDVNTQETLREYSSMANPRFTPDGKYIVGYLTPNVHVTENELVILDIEKWVKRTDIEAPLHNILSYDIRSDGKKVIVSYNRFYEYSIWDIETGKIERTVKFPIEDSVNVLWAEINNLHFGKDDKTIIYTVTRTYPKPKPNEYTYKVSTHIIDAVTGEEVRKVNNGGMLNFSHDKSIVTERYVDTKLAFRVFNVNNWELLWTVPGPLDLNLNYLGQIAYSPDDKFIVAGYGLNKEKILVYDAINGDEKYTYNSGTMNSIDISNDGKYIAGGSGQRLILFDFDFQTTVSDEIPIISNLNSFPNPTKSNSVTIEFNLLNSGETKIQLYDLSSRIVRNIENKFLEAGNHRYEIEILGLSNGQYNVIIESLSGKISHKIMINR